MSDADSAPPAQPAQSAEPLKPSERQWVVTTATRLHDGVIVPNPRAMEEAMMELAPILTRLGGICSIASRRVVVDEETGRIETLSVVIRWQQYSPLERGGEAPEVEQPADAEPVKA